MFNLFMTISDKGRGAINTPLGKPQAEVGTNADLENYKALELNTGGADIRLTKRDIYR